jgi:hypothetical protein
LKNKAAVARALDFSESTEEQKKGNKRARLGRPKVSDEQIPAMHEDGANVAFETKFKGIVYKWILCTPDMKAGPNKKRKKHYFCKLCPYSSDRSTHAQNHYIRIHIKKGIPAPNKRKFTPTAQPGRFILKKRGASSQQQKGKKRASTDSLAASTPAWCSNKKARLGIVQNSTVLDESAAVTDDDGEPAQAEPQSMMRIIEYDDEWSNPCVIELGYEDERSNSCSSELLPYELDVSKLRGQAISILPESPSEDVAPSAFSSTFSRRQDSAAGGLPGSCCESWLPEPASSYNCEREVSARTPPQQLSETSANDDGPFSDAAESCDDSRLPDPR